VGSKKTTEGGKGEERSQCPSWKVRNAEKPKKQGRAEKKKAADEKKELILSTERGGNSKRKTRSQRRDSGTRSVRE